MSVEHHRLLDRFNYSKVQELIHELAPDGIFTIPSPNDTEQYQNLIGHMTERIPGLDDPRVLKFFLLTQRFFSHYTDRMGSETLLQRSGGAIELNDYITLNRLRGLARIPSFSVPSTPEPTEFLKYKISNGISLPDHDVAFVLHQLGGIIEPTFFTSQNIWKFAEPLHQTPDSDSRKFAMARAVQAMVNYLPILAAQNDFLTQFPVTKERISFLDSRFDDFNGLCRQAGIAWKNPGEIKQTLTELGFRSKYNRSNGAHVYS